MPQQTIVTTALKNSLGNVFGVPGLDAILAAFSLCDANFSSLYDEGSVNINFGSAPGTNTATVIVSGQTNITANSYVNAWIQGTDSTADHNSSEHIFILPEHVSVVCSAIVPGVSFTLTAVTDLNLTDNVAVRWAWR